MEPREFLAFAQALPLDSEAARRSAISRAYYAAYHKGRRLLTLINVNVPKSAYGHPETFGCLMNSKNEYLVRAGRKLADLHSRRIVADYELEDQEMVSHAVALSCLRTAEETPSLSLSKTIRKKPSMASRTP
ncbi:MAG: hypothetical protein HY801_12640 [Candidatus Lindowbacteria bacterium]|nr:hypothetical protein [Candidatus Lindowbacteria bacterium]